MLSIHSQNRLTWSKATSFGWFKDCTCSKNNLYALQWPCCDAGCDVSRRRLLKTARRHSRRLEITINNDVDSATLEEMTENLIICPLTEMIDKLSVYAESGINEIIISAGFGQSQQNMIESMYRIGEYVIPHFKSQNSQVA